MTKFLTLTLVLCSMAYANGPKVIYGIDNRVDVHLSTNALFKKLADSTAARIEASLVSVSGAKVSVSGKTLNGLMQVCATEKFANQFAAAECSGFLVGKDLLVTAGHCMRDMNDCNNNVWLFGYNQKNIETNGGLSFPSTEVYHCKEIVSQEFTDGAIDFALIKLDRQVSNHEPLKFRTSGKIAENAKIVVIGNPSGLPTKIADGAQVRNNTHPDYFNANLDTFGGNSGSAVFDAATGIVEGILVRGENDYVPSAMNCYVVNKCKDNECRGEDVVRITQIKKLMSNLASPTPTPVNSVPQTTSSNICKDGQLNLQNSCELVVGVKANDLIGKWNYNANNDIKVVMENKNGVLYSSLLKVSTNSLSSNAPVSLTQKKLVIKNGSGTLTLNIVSKLRLGFTTSSNFLSK